MDKYAVTNKLQPPRPQRRTEEKNSGVQGYGQPRRGSGEPPGLWRIFENLQKNFRKKIAKMHYFSLFSKEFQNYALNL